MEKEVISERQGIVLIIFSLIGSTILIGTGGIAKQDMWFSIIIAVPCSLVILIMYSKILSHYPGKDLFDILPLVLGKYIGKLFSIFMMWYAFHLGAMVMRNFSEFTNVCVFPDTPVILPMIFFMTLCIWGVKAGIEVLGRWSEFFIIVVMVTLLFVTILSISEMDINRIKPFLENGFTPVLKGAFDVFAFPFGETVVFMMVFSNINKAGSYTKIFIVGLLIAGLVILMVAFRNILVLGANEISNSYFPSYTAIALIHIGPFFQRLEMLVAIVFIACSFIKVSMCLLAVCKGIMKVLGFDDYRFTVTPVALLMLELSFIVYSNTLEMEDWGAKIYPYYALPFEVIIPFITFIAVELKARKKLLKL